MTTEAAVALALSIHSATAAPVAGAWKLHTWRQAHGTRVEAFIWFDVVMIGVGGVLGVTVRNRSAHPVRVLTVDLRREDDSIMSFPTAHLHPHASIPGYIGPRDIGHAYLMPEEDVRETFDLPERLTAIVQLAAGELVQSRPTVVHDYNAEDLVPNA